MQDKTARVKGAKVFFLQIAINWTLGVSSQFRKTECSPEERFLLPKHSYTENEPNKSPKQAPTCSNFDLS